MLIKVGNEILNTTNIIRVTFEPATERRELTEQEMREYDNDTGVQ